MKLKPIGAFVTFALLLAACGGDSVEVAPDEAMLQITSEGGFVPVDVALGSGPRFTLLGDGTLIYPGVTTLEFPGRLVPPYFEAHLGRDQMKAVMAMMDDIGLPNIVDELDDTANQFVADASTDVVTYWDENGRHRYAVYALGIQDAPSERNVAFAELIDTLDRFSTGGIGDPYEPERVRVLAVASTTIGSDGSDVRPWPLDTEWDQWQSDVNGWHCRVFGGEILESFDDATQITTWDVPADVFASNPVSLLVRPLHPGEPDCP
ncbi:MAG TPA: hypothetical protein VE569_06280 [Acidimicrobiia bacterium]|jgi:hypothetical protein|nr:hypothetical protein [Acidimicrobiia bacterium]